MGGSNTCPKNSRGKNHSPLYWVGSLSHLLSAILYNQNSKNFVDKHLKLVTDWINGPETVNDIILLEKDYITVNELIDSLIIKSANDAAIAIAEKISGSEKKFVIKMNKYAKKLNLENTNFANPHGLPNRANLSTAYDIFKLSSKIITDFPEHLHRFKKTKSNIKGKVYNTHNTLLKKYDHYIGLKTGYTRKSGFQISLLSISGDDYLLGIYFGGNSAKERNNKINFLMNKYWNKDVPINQETKKIIVKKEKKRISNYTVQTSSF